MNSPQSRGKFRVMVAVILGCLLFFVESSHAAGLNTASGFGATEPTNLLGHPALAASPVTEVFKTIGKGLNLLWRLNDPESFETVSGFIWWVLRRIFVVGIAVMGLGALAQDRKLRLNFWRGGVPALIGLFSPAIGLIAIVVMGGIILAHDPQKP